MVKANLNGSEEDEFTRIIGLELVQKNEELRAELENYMDIVADLQAMNLEEETKEDPSETKTPSRIFLNKNTEFLEKEISFFITNLRRKAKKNGLDEDMLIPASNKRDMQIVSYVQNKSNATDRPVSASTRMSSKYEDTPDNASMASTFPNGFAGKSGKMIPQLPFDKCVLDFGKSEIEIVKEIAKIIEQETTELEEEIQVQQDLVMNRGKPKELPKPVEIEEPSTKELFEFKSRLEEKFLNTGKEENNKSDSFKMNKSKNQLPSLKTKKVKLPLKINKKAIEENGEDRSKCLPKTGKSLKFKRSETTNGISRKRIKIKRADSNGGTPGKDISTNGLKLRKRKPLTTLPGKRAASRPAIKKESIYGLDVDFLKDIGNEDIVKEYKQHQKKEVEDKYQKKSGCILSLEQKFKKPTKLREICKEFRDGM
ncbi:unnamed protein product [Moneuplotes crassus]|uniref:Uncharacterized protein n=1 Tax=Euplotes crassus TaxID=5936 RepID=A0AAD1UA50_EUPCR|nr:unnamed protein product [Moneuplotes crassus]